MKKIIALAAALALLGAGCLSSAPPDQTLPPADQPVIDNNFDPIEPPVEEPPAEGEELEEVEPPVEPPVEEGAEAEEEVLPPIE